MKLYHPEVTRGPVEYRGHIFVFAHPCCRTKSGKHIVETRDDFGEPLLVPWCRQCGLEADRDQEELRGDA